MRMSYVTPAIFLMFTQTSFAKTEVGSNPLLYVMQEAIKNNPRLKSKRYLEQASDENIRLKQSKYYPEISVAAIATTGDPGSFSMFDADGDLGASQRVGMGGSVILKQDIWDFGRTTHAVHSAELEKQMNQQEDVLLHSQVGREVLATYLDCAFLKTQLESSGFIVEQAKLLEAETDHFVRSGQKSVIERYLVDTEEKAAETRVAEYTERLHTTEERIGILLARPENEKVKCESLTEVERDILWMKDAVSTNPLVKIQDVRSQLAESKLAEAHAENHPKIFGMALAGTFDNDHLKDRNHYAAGIGITLPLFSGFSVDSQVGKQEAELLAEQSSVDAVKQTVASTNSSFDERIRSLQVRLRFLESEKSHAKKFFDLAHKRYEDQQGNMIDLRESIKNMNRLILETDQTRRDLLFAQGEKSLFNGFEVSQK